MKIKTCFNNCPAIRKDISLMLRQHIDNVDVLSFTELPDDKKIDVVATINLIKKIQIKLWRNQNDTT